MQLDDAVRVVVANSKFSTSVPGGFFYRKWPAMSGSVDIAPWMAPGTNRLVLVHVVRSSTLSPPRPLPNLHLDLCGLRV